MAQNEQDLLAALAAGGGAAEGEAGGRAGGAEEEGVSASTDTLDESLSANAVLDMNDPSSMLPLHALMVMLLGIPCILATAMAYFFCFKRP